MRPLRFALSLPLLVIASAASAQQQPSTDAEKDGFAGPVKSVSTIATHPGVKWQQPGGPTLVMPIWCYECEYDSDGTKTKSGQVTNGDFQGEINILQRDANGHVTERSVFSASTDELLRHEFMGPFGKTSETGYINGKVNSQRLLTYDLYGHVTEWLSLDATGKQQSRNRTITTKDGIVTERSGWGKDDQLEWRQTYDPKTEEEHFTTYDDTGSVKLTWTRMKGQMVSFWAQSDESPQFGDSFNDDQVNGTVESYHCGKNRPCERSSIHYEYQSPKKRNPTSAESRDAEDHLVDAVYYEYELDAFLNWTHRKVSVWSSEHPERAPYEEDSRTITYWQK